MIANFFNQGEVCCNGTRVFVQRGLVERFSKRIVEEVGSKLTVGDPLKEETRVGATINEGHLNRVLAYIESAREEVSFKFSKGAEVLIGGQRLHPKGVESGFYLAPAVISNLNDNMKVVCEEIFGAVMLILPFDTEDEVVQRANATQYGLAAGIISSCRFSLKQLRAHCSDLGKAHRVAARLQAGTVYINTYNDTEVDVPFGGCKNSGYGRENSIEALQSFTQTKAIYVNVSQKIENSF
ncbi:unnamed protein product [Toxocara canis]|uniref:Aldedh domain-containing protein n=1 Tax=Toxocara canis TaxID=6265 RepID=A0A183UKI3_TOXCA|nr:unnamed protein product [Toxocara canis]